MDLFDTPARPISRPIGHGNAAFLADLAANVPDATMRDRFKRGAYDPIHRASIQAWRGLAGRA